MCSFNKDQLIRHMKNGGHIFRETSKGRFFYKLEADELMCRCNELGGWHLVSEPRWDSDKLQIAELDYEYDPCSTPSLTIKKLPVLETEL